jgi:hypothetical protein
MWVGFGGRGRIATVEEIVNMNNFNQNYFSGGTNVLAANQQINLTPSPNLYDQPITSHEGSRSNQHRPCNRVFPSHPRPSSIIRGSLWAEIQAQRSF